MNKQDSLLQIRLVSSMTRVYPDTELKAKAWIRTTALSGEKVNIQLAYFWKGWPAFGKAEVISDLSGIRLHTVDLEPGEHIWPNNQPDEGCRSMPGLFPDILTPLDGKWRLVPNQWRALWISIDTTGAKAGEYPITIQVKVNEEIMAEETFHLQILPQSLPEQKQIYTQWFHTDCIAHQYHVEVFSERWWELTESYVRFAVEHGINMILTPLFTPPLDTLPGTERLTVQLVDVMVTENGYQFGFSKLERWISMCRRCGVKYFEGSHLFTQWGAEHAPKIMALKDGRMQRIFGWETDAEGAEYTGFLTAFLPEVTAFLCRNECSGNFYFHISDEPSEWALERYGRLSKLVHSQIGAFPVMDALSEYSFYEKGYLDRPVCATQSIIPYLEHGTPHLWAYYCGGQVKGVSNRLFAMPGARIRCIGLQMYDAGIEGFLHWGYNFWLTQYATKVIDPYRVSDAGGGFAAGDSFSVYPGENGPIAAVSLELFAEALQDLRALELAET